jgi:putative flippase GtrA
MMRRQLLRFLAVGVLNTAVGLGTIFALKAVAGWPDVPANIGGYVLGLMVSFVLNRRWTFAHRGDWRGALARFLAVFGVAYTANLVAFLALRDRLGVNPYAAHALAMVVYTAIFFVGSRSIAFRQQTREAMQ